MLEILRRISNGRGRMADLELIKLLGRIAQNANCFHGQGAPTSVVSMFRFFEDELMEHVERKRCPAKVCRGLVRYEVLHQIGPPADGGGDLPDGRRRQGQRELSHRPAEVHQVRRLPGASAVRDRRGGRVRDCLISA